MVSFKVQSIVGAYKTGFTFDLKIIKELFHIQKEPNPPHAINFCFDNPKTTIIFYKSGMIAFMGSRSFSDLKKVKREIFDTLIEADVPIRKNTRLDVWNITATANLNQNLDLEALFCQYYQGMLYNPETFPGIIYHKPNSKLTVLAFASGKIVLVGTKSIDEIGNLLHHFQQLVSNMSKT